MSNSGYRWVCTNDFKPDENKDIVEQFNEFFKKYKKPHDVLDFLFFLGLELDKYNLIADIPENVKNNIVAFKDFFYERFANTRVASLLEKERDATVLIPLDMAFVIEEDKLYKKQSAEIKMLNPEILKEAKSLANIIWAMRKDRELIFILHDAKGNQIEHTLTLEKSIPKNMLKKAHTFLLYGCAAMILSNGGVEMHTFKKESETIFAARTDFNGHWVPIPAQEVYDWYTLTADGLRMELDEGVEINEFSRETK